MYEWEELESIIGKGYSMNIFGEAVTPWGIMWKRCYYPGPFDLIAYPDNILLNSVQEHVYTFSGILSEDQPKKRLPKGAVGWYSQEGWDDEQRNYLGEAWYFDFGDNEEAAVEYLKKTHKQQ